MSSSAYCSITTDLWTAKHQVSRYMGLTCHINDVEWCTKSLVLTTQELPLKHSCDNLATALTNVMMGREIEDKVAGATVDNGSNIVKAMEKLTLFHMPCVFSFQT